MRKNTVVRPTVTYQMSEAVLSFSNKETIGQHLQFKSPKFDHYRLLSPSKAHQSFSLVKWKYTVYLGMTGMFAFVPFFPSMVAFNSVITPKTSCFFTYYFAKDGMLQSPSLGLPRQVYLLLKAGTQCWASVKGVHPSTLRN